MRCLVACGSVSFGRFFASHFRKLCSLNNRRIVIRGTFGACCRRTSSWVDCLYFRTARRIARFRSFVRISGLPDLGRLASDCRSVARAKKPPTVDQGLPTMHATVAMHCKRAKEAMVIPFSTSVIARRVVFLFIRDGGSGGTKFCLPAPCLFGRPTMLQLPWSRSRLSCGGYCHCSDGNAPLRGRCHRDLLYDDLDRCSLRAARATKSLGHSYSTTTHCKNFLLLASPFLLCCNASNFFSHFIFFSLLCCYRLHRWHCSWSTFRYIQLLGL